MAFAALALTLTFTWLSEHPVVPAMNALTPRPTMLAPQTRNLRVSYARSNFCWTPILQKTRCLTGTPLKASCSLPARSLRQGHKVQHGPVAGFSAAPRPLLL